MTTTSKENPLVLNIEPLSESNFSLFADFHRAPTGRGCYCMYWQFTGDNRAWQLQQEQENEQAKLTQLKNNKTHGLLAILDGAVVGTIQLEPRSSLTKLTTRMPYRDLGPADRIWSVGCLLVLPALRRQGIGRQLVAAAIEWVSAKGAIALEAYPRVGEELREDELWTGPSELFRALGFECVREHLQYPVLRRELSLSSEA